MPLLYSKMGVGVTHPLATETRPMVGSMLDWDTFSDSIAFHSRATNRFFNVGGVRLGTSLAAVHNDFKEGDAGDSGSLTVSMLPLKAIVTTSGLFSTVFQMLLDRKIIYSHLGWDKTSRFAIIEIEAGDLTTNLGSVNFAWDSGLGGSTWTNGGVTKSFTKSGDTFQIRSFWFMGVTGINTGTASNPQVVVTMVHRNGQVDNGTTANNYDFFTWNSGEVIGGATIYLHWGTATVDDVQNWIIDDLSVVDLETQNPRVQIVDVLKELQAHTSFVGHQLVNVAAAMSPNSSLTPNRTPLVNPPVGDDESQSINQWDYYYNGNEVITGVVSVEGTPTANKKVVLFDRYTNQPLAATFSDSLGRYSFNNVRNDVPHYVISFDESATFNAVVQDRIVP